MPEEDEISDNTLRMIEDAAPQPRDEMEMDDSLVDDLGFTKQALLDLAYAFNKDEFFKPLGVALIPDDVADCVTVGELIELVQTEFNGETPTRRNRRRGR
jgi:acyl carrier protein